MTKRGASGIFYTGEKMKVAIVGMGVIGKVHYDALKKQGEEIVALCDVDPKKLEGYDGVGKYGDYKDMLDCERIDVVHICTPHYLHCDMATYALAKDVNVLCEKPLCITEEEIERIIDAQDKSKAILGVCFQNRYNASSVFVKKYLEGKKVDFAQGKLAWHRGADYYLADDWRGKRATEGGGVLINQAIHMLDLLQWTCHLPKSVIASVENRSHKDVIEVEDTAHALFKGDVDFEIFATTTANEDMPVEITFDVCGEKIALYPDKVLINGKIADVEKDVQWKGKAVYGNGHEKLIAYFYECLQRGEKFPVDAREGAKSVRMVLACYESCGVEKNI